MPILVKKLFVSFLLFLTVFMSVAPGLSYVKAQTGTWYNSSWFDWYTKVYDEDTSPSSEIFGERYTAAQVEWVLYSIPSVVLNRILSVIPGSTKCIVVFSTADPLDGASCGLAVATFMAESAVKLGISFIATSNNTPSSIVQDISNSQERQISGIGYIRGLSSRLSPVKPAQAQGFGYTKLDTVQQYWMGFRNMAYSIVVLITIVFAFMVMFKVKLNPQTVVTVQSALPNIIGGVILATFSFAIAGFLIDLMYVVGGIFASLLQMAGFATSVSGAYGWIMHPGSLGTTNVLGNFTIFWFMLAYAIYFLISLIVAIITIAVGNVVIFGLFGTIVSILFIGLLFWIIILMFVYMVKIPWVLIKNLVSIYVSIVVAPLQIMMGTLIPSIGFGAWLKKLISELLVFPVTGLFMYLAWLTLGSSIRSSFTSSRMGAGAINMINTVFGSNVPTGVLWAPDIIGGTGEMSSLLWLAVSFSFIAMLPKIIDIMKAMVMGERFSFGNAMQEAVGPLNWGKDAALSMTGARDTWEIAQIARRARLMKKYIGERGAFRPIATWLVGGRKQNAGTALDKQISNYTERSGTQQVE